MTKKKSAVSPEALQNAERPCTHTFEDGTVVTLNALGEGVLIGLMSDYDKPTPPVRRVPMAGGGVKEIPRDDDEPLLSEAEIEAIKDPTKRAAEEEYHQYRLKLTEWNTRSGLRFARTLFLLGVIEGPPADDTALWRAIGWTNPYDIKYNWLAYKCRTTAEWERFIQAIVSFSMPDEEGTQEMAEMFRATVARPPEPSMANSGDMAQ